MRNFLVIAHTFCVLVFFGLPASGKPIKSPNSDDRARQLETLQGVWEQTRYYDERGNLSELNPKQFDLLKSVLVTLDDYVYEIRSTGLGVKTRIKKINLHTS